MRARNVAMTLALGAALLAGGLPVANAADTTELPLCATVPHRSVPVHIESPGQWSYDHYLIWCGHDGRIDWTVPVVTNKIPEGSNCEWRENQESQTRDGDYVHGFAMSEFSCGKDDEPGYEVHPWSIVGVQPDGRSWVVAKGID